MKHKISKIKNAAAEAIFWASHNSTDYVDWHKGEKVVFPKLRVSTQVRKDAQSREFTRHDLGCDIAGSESAVLIRPKIRRAPHRRHQPK